MKLIYRNRKLGSYLYQGITLIELMIVIVIVGILASIAYPAYTESVRKSKRTEGVTALLDVAQAQERFFSRNFSFASSIAADLGFSGDPYISEEGNYSVAITIPGACVSGTVNTCFTATATAIGSQATDSKCGTMTINDRGVKTSANGGTDTTGQCW